MEKQMERWDAWATICNVTIVGLNSLEASGLRRMKDGRGRTLYLSSNMCWLFSRSRTS
jgi:hypothetical protein